MRVHGSLQSDVVEGAPPPRRDFFLSRMKKTTDDDVLKNFIKDQGIALVDLRLVSNENAIYKSYKLSVSVDDKDKVMSPNLWPKGVCIEKWRERNNRKID